MAARTSLDTEVGYGLPIGQQQTFRGHDPVYTAQGELLERARRVAGEQLGADVRLQR